MAQFHGKMKGARGEVSRLGNKVSGMTAHLRGWNIGVRIELTHTGAGKDRVVVYRTTGSSGGGGSVKMMEFQEP